MGFSIPTTDEPRLSQAAIINTVTDKSQLKTKRENKREKKKITKRENQISLLLSDEEYALVLQMKEDTEMSMTKIIRKFITDKGFFND